MSAGNSGAGAGTHYRYSPSVYKPSAEPLLAALLLSSESHYWQHRHHDTPLRSTPLSHAAGVVISKMFPFSTIRVSMSKINLRYHISVAHSSDAMVMLFIQRCV